MSYIFHAFKHKYNLVFMGAGLLAGLFFFNPMYYPVLFIAEGLILFAAATNKQFQQVVRSREGEEEEHLGLLRQKNVIRGSRSAMKHRLTKVEDTIRQIKQNTRQNSKASVESSSSMLTGIDELEKNYVRLLHSYCRLDDLELRNAQTGNIKAEIEKVKAELATAQSETRETIEKRLEILQKRDDNATIAAKNKIQLLAQIDMVEESFKLMVDQSVSVYDPGTISKQVDEVTQRMETTRQTLIEIEKFSSVSDAAIDLSKLRTK